MAKICILGSSGTVGLSLISRLASDSDIEIQIVDARSEDVSQLRGDIAVLCLPGAVALEVAAKLPTAMRILDCSPAHRLHSEWTYGLPELSKQQEAAIRDAHRVANPGCYATGAILLLAPLKKVARLKSYPVAIFGTAGYTAGGHRLIEEQLLEPLNFRVYGLDLAHRHIPEIQRFAGLARPPLFTAGVGAYPCGSLIQIPLDLDVLQLSFERLQALFNAAYGNTKSITLSSAQSFIEASDMAGKDTVELFVIPGDSPCRALLMARYDNLGKGAAGAAVQNLRIMLGRQVEG